MKEHFIATAKTARYFTLGEPSGKIENVWFVCHGYGQLARYFIQKFEALNNGKNYVVAPEGFSRFYLQGFSGRVGATWMTKEDRLNDIKDYINYLNRLHAAILDQFEQEVKVNVLGFSQGSATVSRWIKDGKVKPDKFILWAGLFPPDMDFEVDAGVFRQFTTFLVCGNQDEFMSMINFQEQEKTLKQNRIDYHKMEFTGKHDIDPDTLIKIQKF